MCKSLFVILMLLCCPMCLQAQDYLRVEEKSGDESSFDIGKIEEIRFQDGKIVISAEGTVLAEFALDAVNQLLFSDEQGGYAEINPGGMLEFYRSGDTVGVDGLTEPATACIVNMGGQVCRVVKEWTGKPAIDISGLPGGVYVLAVGKSVFKFTK